MSNSSSTTPISTNPTTTPLVLSCGLDLQEAELPCILIFTLIVNIVAFVVLWRMRGTYDSVDHLLISILNINDLLTTVMFTVTWLVGLASCGELLLSDGVCGVFGWLGSALIVWSAFIVLIMTSLRCLSLVKPFYYRSYVTSKLVVRAAVGTFVFCFILFLVPFTTTTGKRRPFRLYTENLICALDFAPGGFTTWHRAFIGFIGVVGMGTVLFVLACNHLIIKTLRKQTSIHTTGSSNTVATTNTNAVIKRRVFQRVTMVVSLVYVLCYGPFVLRLLVDTAFNLDHQDYMIHSVTSSLLFMSPLLNPLVYGLFNKGFRGILIKLIKCEKKDPSRNVTTVSRLVS